MNRIIYGLVDFALTLYFIGIYFDEEEEYQPKIDMMLKKWK